MKRVIQCRNISEVLAAYLMGELEPARAALVRAHLEACEKCRVEADALRATLDVLRQAAQQTADLPTHLERRRVEEILAAKSHPLMRWMEQHFVILAVIVVSAILLNILFLMRRRLAPREPPDEQPIPVQVAPRPRGSE